MENDATFTLYMRDYDCDHPTAERICKVMVGNQTVRCTGIELKSSVHGYDTLTLIMPLINVDFVTLTTDEEIK